MTNRSEVSRHFMMQVRGELKKLGEGAVIHDSELSHVGEFHQHGLTAFHCAETLKEMRASQVGQ